jgi:hypothetical protein
VGRPLDPYLAPRTFARYLAVIDRLRASARGVGYALTVHGSLSRDIDLVAVAWVQWAVPAEVLADVIIGKLHLIDTVFHVIEPDRDGPRAKPHGRLAWSILLEPYHGPYIDLSVIPPKDAP